MSLYVSAFVIVCVYRCLCMHVYVYIFMKVCIYKYIYIRLFICESVLKVSRPKKEGN